MSLGLLVGRFGNFLRERPQPPPTVTPAPAFPETLSRLRGQFGHHIVLLGLLSRADGDPAPVEREVIFKHCIDRAQKSGLSLTANDAAELGDYLRDLRPARTQLDHALKELERDPKDEIVALVEAAIALIDADGVRRPEEQKFLAELTADLESLEA